MPSCRISKSAGSSDLDKQSFRQVRPLHLNNRFSPAIRSSRKLSHGEHAHTVNPHLRIEMWAPDTQNGGGIILSVLKRIRLTRR